MKRRLAFAATALALSFAAAYAQDTSMSFFVTSANPGKGGDLGGLAGADAYCNTLATASGSTGKNWKAYLSTDTENAKDRIGTGPWYNAKGEKVADDVAALHGDANNLTKQTALNEKGEVINGRGDTPNRHDILTGSLPDGTAAPQRSRRPRRIRGSQILELFPRDAWRLHPGCIQGHGRRRTFLLLRRKLGVQSRPRRHANP
jgi:hypothetical protein